MRGARLFVGVGECVRCACTYVLACAVGCRQAPAPFNTTHHLNCTNQNSSETQKTHRRRRIKEKQTQLAPSYTKIGFPPFFQRSMHVHVLIKMNRLTKSFSTELGMDGQSWGWTDRAGDGRTRTRQKRITNHFHGGRLCLIHHKAADQGSLIKPDIAVVQKGVVVCIVPLSHLRQAPGEAVPTTNKQ